jgi:transcriptional regulator with XRE-family HTH domain
MAIKNDEIATRLREERQRLGLSQAEFGALGGIKIATQTRYENGSNQPTSDYLASVAAAGVDVLFVLTGRSSGEMLSALETTIIHDLRALPVEMAEAVAALIQAMLVSLA